ncbi:ribosome recycling factor [Candidatus Curtissbacteria bacterium RIFOXYB1_FULL_41_59]|uniref:Ribosome recycling factor n=1 Tax=Candidatus Curtissbacteria bacterium RIFOXYA1_FULL_41_14 TaxID=1797737 RepID=A0A1F5HEH8_9BACT|nr:MAG: Ribosome-recycling factor [Candidatus Curtissbacteria bacterium GW2011_GWB1_40_28]KKR62058.1 MAG: Ribosome-recycling factor [Microgenomates group bacterium GW2011_GWC1_40_35]KKR75683.1 MAG: Ribosome-recycling factor [Candidatus Curtissbacteria bacterium GW2011_GWD1_40_8]KKS01973.1 MAG: Ribosome-recycling factor [Candidatus Curtissbacteria bacterium GW2011_GWC2_41_21]OGE02486.1 MAG: ribosome recycling factor [Candidatus Curtissbacteria bacterium RIFOXYA1_FULL_41_14]OGE04097.1 MAG: ribos
MLAEVSNKMRDAISHLKVELAQIRTGRASGTLVSDIQVDAYNSKMMVKELAQITTPEPTVILISPWDKSIITNIVGGIAKADIGLNSVVDGDIIRIAIPPLTSERRDQFIKNMHQILEKYRVEIRQIRHEFVEKLREAEQTGEMSEDEEKRQKEEIQKLHDEFIEAIEVAGKAKEAELRQV